jgi:predicted DNA-binding transcriptional regulator AlpA
MPARDLTQKRESPHGDVAVESPGAQGKELLSETEVENELGLSRPWLRRCRLERRGPRFLKLGSMVRYSRTDLFAYLNERIVETKN